MNTQLDIADLVNQQIRQTLTEYLSGIDLRSLVEQAMSSAVEDAVLKMSVKTAEAMITQRDLPSEVLKLAKNKIDSQVDTQVRTSIKSVIAATDIKKMVNEAVDQHLNLKIRQYDFPEASVPASSIDWAGVKFSGNMIDGGIVQNFNSTGIQDNATECQLTLVDGVIVAEGHVITRTIKADGLDAKDLRVTDSIELEGKIIARGQAKDSLDKIAADVLESKLNSNLDIRDTQILSQGKPILNSTTLGPSVINSNLRKLGLLQDLRVSGTATFAETMTVNEHNRVGINTDEPSGALTIWDQDAEINIIKSSKKNMYVGTTRDTTMSLGTNNKEQIKVKQSEISFEDPVRIMGIKVRVCDKIPEDHGEPDEIAFVRNAKDNQPRFYICQGGNRWAMLGDRA